MNLSLEALRILDAIARKGSFAAAAIELDRVPSALTYSMRKLEEDLDVLLFDRRGHRAKLTAAGQELLNEGRNLLTAAEELEQRVRRAAKGWETELRIVCDQIIPFRKILPLIADFDRMNSGTRLRFSHETLSGTWEALTTCRADLVIGAINEGPDVVRMSGGYETQPLGDIEWIFAVSPDHPLATAPEPLTPAAIQQHRAVAVGDTARILPAVTAGLLTGQPTLTVPGSEEKLEAQLAGLGCGYLPRSTAMPYLQSGELIEKQITAAKPRQTAHFAWRTAMRGKSLKWFLQRLAEPETQRMLLGE